MMEKTLVLLVLLTALELRAAAQSTATCQALQNVADSASGVTCTRNSQCSELLCGVTETTLLQYIRSATLTLLPCSQPAAVRLALYNPSDTVFLNRTVNRTTTILAVDGVLSLVVRLDHLINAIGLGMNGEVTITIPGLGPRSTTVTIFQYTEIPLDTSACLPATTAPTVVRTTATSESGTTSTTTGVTTGTSSQATSATSPPTSPSATTATGSQATATTATTSSPTLAQTCQALDTLVDSAQSLNCSRNVHCDTVQCSVVDPTVRAFISTAILMLLPCNQPPAVRLSGTNPSGSMVLDRVITQSQTIPLQPGTTLGVTLDQLPNAIGFQANASAIVLGFTSSTTLVPYARIPIDSSACSKPVCPTETCPTCPPEVTCQPTPECTCPPTVTCPTCPPVFTCPPVVECPTVPVVTCPTQPPVIPPPQPAQIEVVDIFYDENKGTKLVAWNIPEEEVTTYSLRISYYDIFLRRLYLSSKNPWLQIQVTDLPNQRPLWIEVRARNSGGSAPWSSLFELCKEGYRDLVEC